MIRKVDRRGRAILVIDILYKSKNGTNARYRHDAQVQTMAAATAEERQILANIASYGAPFPPSREVEDETETPRGPTFAEVVAEYRRTFMVTDLKPTTQRGYDSMLDATLLPWFGDGRSSRSTAQPPPISTSTWSRKGFRSAPARTRRSF